MEQSIRHPRRAAIAAALVACATLAGALSAFPTRADDKVSAPVPSRQGWLVNSYEQIERPAAPAIAADQQASLKAMVAKRRPEDIARFHWWAAGGPVYRWNEIILDEMQVNFVTLPISVRHLALFHAALDDAVAAAWHYKGAGARPGVVVVDGALKAGAPGAKAASPSDYAGAAAAAAEMLAYFFPTRAADFAAKAEEAMQVRLLAGAEFPSDIEAGRQIGRRVAALAIARGKLDGSDAVWRGSIPEGPGSWKGTNPIAPATGTWQTWVLSSASELRPPAPPAFDSEQVKAALAELKTFARTPKTNHRATFWEVNGGARAHTLWNDLARTKLLENGTAPVASARLLAALNIALLDAGIACWDAKYAYWYIRPSQLDAELKPLFPPPNHPSYPAAHGCFSTAAAAVLAAAFPLDRDRLLALGTEAAEARVWAGIHYRFDIDAGQEIGRKVAEKTLRRSFASPMR
jgi:membrane-associated phospholipid phosphatase